MSLFKVESPCGVFFSELPACLEIKRVLNWKISNCKKEDKEGIESFLIKLKQETF